MPQNKGRFLRLPADVHAYLDYCLAQHRADPAPEAGYNLLPCRVVTAAIRGSQMYHMWKQTRKPVTK